MKGVIVVCKHADPGNELQAAAERLNLKLAMKHNAFEIAPLPMEPEYDQKLRILQSALADLDETSKIYLQGHGNWKAQTVGGVAAYGWVQRLKEAKLNRVGKISILGCQAGRDLGTADEWRVSRSVDSFASRFHSLLKSMLRIECRVDARLYDVKVDYVGTKQTAYTDTSGTTPFNKGPYSKISYEWSGGQQVRKFTYEQQDVAAD